MRVLVLSTLFPSQTRPTFGVFVRERLRHVARYADVIVVAPIPWFPGNRWIRGRECWATPFVERQDELTVYHPRILSIPWLGKSLDGALYGLSILPFLLWLRRRFRFDLIDAEFGYPDGVAAALLGRVFRRRVLITMRGDEGRIADYTLRRLQMAWALKWAQVITVSEALRELAPRFGVDTGVVRVIANGVDTAHFHPSDRRAARVRLDLPEDRVILLAVGEMLERKGHHRVLEVLPQLLAARPDLLYIAVGDPVRGDRYPVLVEDLVSRHRLQEHVRFVPVRPHEEIPYWMAAADLFCLATAREGCCNAIIEALACGLPVVTTRVGGNAELVREGQDGFLVPFWDGQAFAAAVLAALDRDWDRNAIVAHACRRSWDDTAKALIAAMQGQTLLSGRSARTTG